MEGEKVQGDAKWRGGSSVICNYESFVQHRPVVLNRLLIMADVDSVRQRIISSVFNRRNAAGSSEETYISHVKIWEDAGPEADLKPRYILLARMPKSCYVCAIYP